MTVPHTEQEGRAVTTVSNFLPNLDTFDYPSLGSISQRLRFWMRALVASVPNSRYFAIIIEHAAKPFGASHDPTRTRKAY